MNLRADTRIRAPQFYTLEYITLISFGGVLDRVGVFETPTLELSDKSKVATNMAAMTVANTTLTITPAVVILFSQFWCLITCLQAQAIYLNTHLKGTIAIYWRNANYLIKLIKINGNPCHLQWCSKFPTICNYIQSAKYCFEEFDEIKHDYINTIYNFLSDAMTPLNNIT